jgi:cyclic lactone autoinducer peptide
MFSRLIAIAAALSASTVLAYQPAEPFKPGKLPPAEVAALQPGLTLRFRAKAGDAKSLDARRVRLAALHVPKGDPPTPFCRRGPFM